MALGCLQDNATMTNDNSNRRRHLILSACGGFLFSRKSVAHGALHPFYAKTPHFPPIQIKLPLQQSPSWLVLCNKILLMTHGHIFHVFQLTSLSLLLLPSQCHGYSLCSDHDFLNNVLSTQNAYDQTIWYH